MNSLNANTLALVTNAITGNAASSQATVVPSLNSINDPLVQIINTTEVPSQGQTFLTNYQNLSISQIFPFNINSNNLTYLYTTTGHTRLNDHILQIGINVTFQTIGTGINLPNPQSDNNLDGYLRKYVNHVPYAFLQWINNQDIRIGSNSLQLGLAPMNTQTSGSPLNQTASTASYYFGYSEDVSKYITAGIPGKSLQFQTYSLKNNEVFEQYIQYLKEIYISIYLQQGAAPTQTMTGTIPITIPYYLIHSFFINENFIPPNVSFRHSFTVDTSLKTIFVSEQAVNNILTATYTFDPSSVYNLLTYFNTTLSPSAQKLYNEQWFAQPIVLHSSVQEYYDFPQQAGTQYNQQARVSTQIPRQMIIKVFNNTQSNQSITGTYCGGGINLTFTNFPNQPASGIIIDDLKVYINGRNNLEYITNVATKNILGSATRLQDSNNILVNKNLLYTERHGNVSSLERSNPVSLFEEFTVIINLDPSLNQTFDYKTMDPGSTNIRLSFTLTDAFSNPIGTNYTVRVYSLLDNQVTINAAGQASQIIWPATALSSNKPPAIAQTFNQSA